MNSLINYLRSPELVYKVQILFGIQFADQKLTENDKRLNKSDSNSLTRRNVKKESCDQNETERESEDYKIGNLFWYYLFLVGTELGDELFFATFLPFFCWNCDSAVGRRFVFVWAFCMYVGQALKDVIREERPGLPARQLQKKFSDEYGLPSTHATSALSIPLSIIIYTLDKYAYNVYVGLLITIIWVSVICLSRIYLGMHSFLDIVTGIIWTLLLMVPAVPIIDRLDSILVTNLWALLLMILVTALLIVYYPKADKWTSTRNDTTVIVAVFVGCYIGASLNYQLGFMHSTDSPKELIAVSWPSGRQLGLVVLRTVLGLAALALTELLVKFISYYLICCILGQNKKELKKSEDSLENKPKIIADLFSKSLTYGAIGVLVVFLMPWVFSLIGIERNGFYNEL